MRPKPEFPDQPFTDVNKGATPNDPRPKHRSEFFTALNVTTKNTACRNAGHKFHGKSLTQCEKIFARHQPAGAPDGSDPTSVQDGRLA